MLKTLMDRRAFVSASSAGVIAVAVGGTLMIDSPVACAMPTKALIGSEVAILAHMARALYPHAMLPDAIYGKVISGLDEKAAADPALLRLLQEAAATLKARNFATLDDAGQAAVLKQIETTAPFQAVRGACVTGIYNNPDVWKVLGYEGASAELGGYIHRGFNDIDWLQDV
jgi:hypothetical protein